MGDTPLVCSLGMRRLPDGVLMNGFTTRMNCDKPALAVHFPFISCEKYRASPRFSREYVAHNTIHIPSLATFCSYRQPVHATTILPVVWPRGPRSCSSPTRWSRFQRPPAPRAQTTRTPHRTTTAKAWWTLPVLPLEILLLHQPSEGYHSRPGLASLRLRLSLQRMMAPPAATSAQVNSQVGGCLRQKARDYPRPPLERPQLCLARMLMVAIPRQTPPTLVSPAQSSKAGRTRS